MKTLIVEDEFTSRVVLQKMLLPYGESHIAVNGQEAVDAFEKALNSDEPYDLICLDIMIPEMDGFEVLKTIREIEKRKGAVGDDYVKIIMTTSINNPKSIMKAFNEQCEAYLVKPLKQDTICKHLQSFGFLR